MGCRSSKKSKKVLKPQRKHAISEHFELSELGKTETVVKSGTVLENKDGEYDQKVTLNAQPSIMISSYEEPEQQVRDTGNEENTLQENGTTTNIETIEENGTTTNIETIEEKGIPTNIETIEEKRVPTNKQTIEEKRVPTNKQTIAEKIISINKQTIEEKKIPTNKQIFQKKGISTNKQTIEEEQTTESKQTPLERFLEHELAIERVKQALTRYFAASEGVGGSSSETVSSQILACYPDSIIQPAARLDRLVCQSDRIPAADFVTYVITCETSPDNARNVVYVFHIFARRGEYRTADGVALAGEYLSAPYLLDGGGRGDPIQCKFVRINSTDAQALSEDKLPQLFSLRGKANTEAFKWTEEMQEQDFTVRKLGARQGSWDFSAFNGIAIVV